MEDLELARAVSRNFHTGQMYGNYNYIYHLEAVVDSLSREDDERLPVIGMLHDILEDTICTTGLLQQLFDKDIVDAVKAITKIPTESYEAYIAKVKGNALAKKVKMHDTLKNLEESLLGDDMGRVRKYSKQLSMLAAV